MLKPTYNVEFIVKVSTAYDIVSKKELHFFAESK